MSVLKKNSLEKKNWGGGQIIMGHGIFREIRTETQQTKIAGQRPNSCDDYTMKLWLIFLLSYIVLSI